MYRCIKRDGKVVDFEISKIGAAIEKAFVATDTNYTPDIIDFLALKVTADFQKKIKDELIAVEDIQDSVEHGLGEAGYGDVAKAYILYRKQHENLRNIDETVLDYKKTVSTPAKYIVTADRRGLIDAVERVSLIINEKVRSPLRFVFEKNQLLINCSTALGQASDEVTVAGDGEGMEIGFNNRYVLDALKAAPADEVAIRLVNNVSPCIIVPADESDSFLYMILPVRIRER